MNISSYTSSVVPVILSEGYPKQPCAIAILCAIASELAATCVPI